MMDLNTQIPEWQMKENLQKMTDDEIKAIGGEG